MAGIRTQVVTVTSPLSYSALPHRVCTLIDGETLVGVKDKIPFLPSMVTLVDLNS